MLRILQASLQQYVNWELPNVQVGFRKGRGTREQIANIPWIMEKTREFLKNATSASLAMIKPLTVWITANWKIQKEMWIPDHLTCFLRSLYTNQEERVRIKHGTTDWFQIGKRVHWGSILSPAYLTSMQSTSCKMPGWMNHKLESRLQGEISITSDMQMTPPLRQKVKKN